MSCYTIHSPSWTAYFDDQNRLHRDNGPARVWSNGQEEWLRHGLRHRDGDLPAIEYGYDFRFEWWVAERLHREGDQPAVVTPRNQEWFLDGKRSRGNDQPAVRQKLIFENGQVGFNEEWWTNGVRHRANGNPAIIELNPSTGLWMRKEWWLNGRLDREFNYPAVVLNLGGDQRRYEWFYRGVRHRNGGPAIKDTRQMYYAWYENGELIAEKQFKQPEIEIVNWQKEGF